MLMDSTDQAPGPRCRSRQSAPNAWAKERHQKRPRRSSGIVAATNPSPRLSDVGWDRRAQAALLCRAPGHLPLPPEHVQGPGREPPSTLYTGYLLERATDKRWSSNCHTSRPFPRMNRVRLAAGRFLLRGLLMRQHERAAPWTVEQRALTLSTATEARRRTSPKRHRDKPRRFP